MSDELLDLFGARTGIVCAVGAGGKKSTLYRLGSAHPGRVAQTASVVTPPFPADLGAHVVVAAGDDLLDQMLETGAYRCVAYATPDDRPDRHGGVGPDRIAAIHDRCGFDVTFVKADGARMRWLKAPRVGEPVLPPGCTTVLAVVSARAIGEPLCERTAHRVGLVSAVTGASAGETITPAHLGKLLSSPRGLLQGVDNARIVPVINMVDDAASERLARDAAEIALAATDRYDRIVLCCMRHPRQPVVGVVER